MLQFTLPNLLIGTASAAVQIEGGDRNNNWYDYAQQPGAIADGSSPVRATDHWNRWGEDTDLMASLGLPIYRLGVEWSRIEPQPGTFDADALAHYRAELTALRDAGIRPLVTLHHFTNPRWFQERGEWTSPDAPQTWLRFVERVVDELGDLVDEWVTINEPNVYATQCHLWGEGPPGTSSWPNTLKVLRHMAIAHIRAYRLIHRLQPHAKVGFAHHVRAFAPMNRFNPVHHVLARLDASLFQDIIADAMLGGRWSPMLGRRPADITRGRYYDYLGVNYYTRTAVKGMSDATFPDAQTTDLGWEIHPVGLITAVRRLSRRHPGPIWVTENGAADNGDPETGEMERFRCRFIVDHLRVMAGSGLPFERYYHWCFVDNWEWSEGEVPRFGIVANDYATQTRTVKPSGRMLAQIVRDGAVTRATIDTFVKRQSYAHP